MFQVGKSIISEELLDEHFVCDLSKCKGACCVEGEAGAPLEKEELSVLESVFPEVKPYLDPKGLDAIERQGLYVETDLGELETPLIDGGACAYLTYNKEGIALCGIEQAYLDGKISWKKPISCHLYPIRIKSYTAFSAVNYHKWQICDDACSLGEHLKIPIYKFVKEALVRKFGEDWYAELEEAAKEYYETK